MSQPTTLAMLKGVTARIEVYAHELGMLAEHDRIVLQEGSKTYGNAFRIWRQEPGSFAHHSLGINDYLGMTKAEAWDSLHRILDTLAWVSYQREQAARADAQSVTA